MSSPLPLEIKGLSRRFGAVQALRDVTLNVPEGSIYAFLGPNGAGKTTAIRCMLGLIQANGGEVRIAGHDLRRKRTKALASVGAVVETPALFPNLTGRENLALTARVLGHEKAEIDRVLDVTEMSHAAERRVGQYSLGMRQRVGIARALLGRPRLLVLDEPSNGLDPAGIRDMRSLIKALPERENTTVFMSSHLLSEVEQTATHVSLMRAGSTLFSGSLDELAALQPTTIRLKADPASGAEQIASNAGFSTAKEDDTLVLTRDEDITLDTIAELNRTLIAADIAVHELRLAKSGLEEIFLKMAHDETPAKKGEVQ
ncbi:ATP-binding cassette domain-containing protein [Maricaulis sp.]|uniref:ABC transporter ATP-binding protein n=1 Tax=Maricaulis sp. TaxID=1486257 RepID=UPI001B0EF20E|nr:ATP-binding cassette domain-containing protein [Maricaulis sp.]MBO6796944.1 ATP-binding cassette domain-containing protein [Maricaulis sp.]